MSTNYYANVKLVGDETTPEVRLHLGKSSVNLVIVDGNTFPTFQAMVDFLTHNAERTVIESETGITSTVEEFVAHFRSFDKAARARQFHEVKKMNNLYTEDRHALDPEGFTISTGVWL